MLVNESTLIAINTPVRQIQARVELYEGSTLADTYNQYYALKEFTVERVGDTNKFFGYGICQKTNVKLIDKERYIHITTADSFKHYLAVGGDYISSFPQFYVTEVHRDENTNELSVTAYDAIYDAAAHTTAEIELSTYTIGEYAAACAALLGVSFAIEGGADAAFDTQYENGANFSGTETIRTALDAIAEATQTIYFINSENVLVFKRLDVSGDAVFSINKNNYITLKNSDNRRLSAVCHATELGDNVIASLDVSGTTQYIRNNPFWDLRDDIGTLVDAALAAVGGLTVNQFECTWRGNFLLEVGDKISLTTKDNDIVYSYLLDDVITYNGGLSAKTKWQYTCNSNESATNPTSLGDALKQTFARVDKAAQEIELLASESTANSEAISSLQLNTDSINASVQTVRDETEEAFNTVNESIATLTNKVDLAITADDVTIAIQSQLENGVGKVVTSTGYKFDDEGLTVSKTDSEMKTQITDDGMTVYKNDEAVLTANNIGVDAVNLHATTYLIIGTNSRFEDYLENRTGCFWIGGA